MITYNILTDRVFWIYFIITLFFVIMGLYFIISLRGQYMIYVSIFWLSSLVILMVVIYHASINWGPDNVCVVDNDSGCFEKSNRLWLLINLLFLIMLVLAVLWTCEFNNAQSQIFVSIFILLCGLLLSGLFYRDTPYTTLPLIGTIIYLVIWVILSMYSSVY